jgi:hypothetical protein
MPRRANVVKQLVPRPEHAAARGARPRRHLGGRPRRPRRRRPSWRGRRRRRRAPRRLLLATLVSSRAPTCGFVARPLATSVGAVRVRLGRA